MDVTRRVVPIARASQTATPRTGFEALLSIYLTTAPARGMLTANQQSLTRGLQGISQFTGQGVHGLSTLLRRLGIGLQVDQGRTDHHTVGETNIFPLPPTPNRL